ncbi:hypothetical protein GA0070610_0013 [Micromonospora echinofusca]|uniref:Uncharacterized protein n=1 Tax=Micromonospora echinofusca TaxID=47858 RepID=A0A1C5G2G5_MICEH|nr:hypothetical protein GA0070610_0013 [Micromonospora echinofusca]
MAVVAAAVAAAVVAVARRATRPMTTSALSSCPICETTLSERVAGVTAC